jgi:hypothetical protein
MTKKQREKDRNSSVSLFRARLIRGVVRFVAIMIIEADDIQRKWERRPSTATRIVEFNVVVVVV